MKRVWIGLAVMLLAVVTLEGFADGTPRADGDAAAPSNGSGVSVDRRAERLHIVLAQGGAFYGIEDHVVYVSEDTGRSYRRLGKLTKDRDGGVHTRVKDFVARRGITRHLRRYERSKAVAILASGTMLIFYDRIYRSGDGGRSFNAVSGTVPIDCLPVSHPRWDTQSEPTTPSALARI